MKRISIGQVVGLSAELSKIRQEIQVIREVVLDEGMVDLTAKEPPKVYYVMEPPPPPMSDASIDEILPAIRLLRPEDTCAAEEDTDCRMCSEDQQRACYMTFVPKAKRRRRLLADVPYTKEDILKLRQADRLALAGAFGINVFKLPKRKSEDVADEILRRQAEALNSGKA